jgi:predicted TIM-barrel fold metal-dependent hydrolase
MKSKETESKDRAIWSRHRIIDIHVHTGSFSGFDIGPRVLLDNLQKYNIAMALVSNIDGAELPGVTANLDEAHANQDTEQLVNSHPDKLRGLIWVRPEDGSVTNIAPFVSAHLAGKGTKHVFVGMKFHPDMNHFLADDTKVDPYLDVCVKNHLVAVFHTGQRGSNSDPERIYKVGQRHPTVPIILYHMGFGGYHQAAIDVVSRSLKNHDATLYLETAQADPQAVLEAIRQVGADHVLFGTDATYYGKLHYDSYEALLKTLEDNLAPRELEKVLHGNAERIFHLPPELLSGKFGT